MIHIYNRILLCHKKEWSNAICNNMDGPKDYHTTKTNIIWYGLYVESKKMIQMNLFTKEEQIYRYEKQTYG